MNGTDGTDAAHRESHQDVSCGPATYHASPPRLVPAFFCARTRDFCSLFPRCHSCRRCHDFDLPIEAIGVLGGPAADCVILRPH
jgi:hypothetical protein